MAHLSPEALKRELDAGEDLTIIDLRTPLDVTATPLSHFGKPVDRGPESETLDSPLRPSLRELNEGTK